MEKYYKFGFSVVIPLVIILLIALISGYNSNKKAVALVEQPSIAVKTIQKDKSKQEQNEKDFIKEAIESYSSLEDNTEKLKTLFGEMNVKESGWLVKTQLALDDIQMDANSYTIATDHLSDDQRIKYSKTDEYSSEGVKEFHNIYNTATDALDTYNKKKLQEISAQLDSAISLIKKGEDQLAIERYN
jgi:hypothetical protein